MNQKPYWPLLLVAALAAAPAAAQEEPEGSAPSDDLPSILRAITLPDLAEALRSRGIPTEEIEAAIEGARQREVPPEEMAGVFEETAEAVEETGPIENFGAFVQEQLAAGMRGRELAEAIRAEHARRGIGQGRMIESRNRGQGAARGQGPQGQTGATRGGGAEGGPPGRAGREGVGPDSMRPDSMADTAGGGGSPMGRGQRGRRPDSMPARPDTSGSGGGQMNGGQR